MKKFILLAVASVFSISMFAQTRKIVPTNKKPNTSTVVTRPNTQAACATNDDGIFTCTPTKGQTGKTTPNTNGNKPNLNRPVVNTPNPKAVVCATDEIGQFTCKPGSKKDAVKAKRDVQTKYENTKNKAAEAFK